MAGEMHLRFYEELNDYLPPDKRNREFAYPLNGKASIRQVLETLGVPVQEVELVLVNGLSDSLSRVLRAGDRVSVYPVFESLDVTSLLRIRKDPLRQTRFITDSGLSRLAFYLRFLGFDVLIEDPVSLAVAEEERRILLTTDPASLSSGLSRVYVVRKTEPREQLKEVLSRLDL
jgi:uncharacterized protein